MRIIVFLLGIFLLCNQPALASIHAYPEAENQVMYRSIQSFRDTNDRAWQTVLFKRVKSGLITSVHLRLSGFPGIEVQHPSPLTIEAGRNQQWTAEDVADTAQLPPNVAEYDVMGFMQKIEGNPPLRLSLKSADQKIVRMIIPPLALKEWHQLMDQ